MKSSFRSLLSVIVLAVPAFAFGCAAQAGSTDEASQTQGAVGQTKNHPKPEMVSADAKFSQWIVRPDGKLSGLLLDDGSIVHVRSDLVKDTSTLKAGDAVHVEGFTFGKGSDSSVKSFGMAKVTKDGNVIVDAPKMPTKEEMDKMHAMHQGKMHHGPKDGLAMKGDHGNKKHDGVVGEGKKPEHKGPADGNKKWGLDESKLQTVSSTATIAQVLPGRHGKGVGMLILSDGTVAYAPRHGDTDTLATLKKGDSITVSGVGGTYPQGKALLMKSVTLPSGEVKQLSTKA